MKDYVLQDGSIVRQGNWICLAQRAMMNDPQRYFNAGTFDGFRFARANDLLSRGEPAREVPDKKPSNLTGSNVDWPIWGLGNTTW